MAFIAAPTPIVITDSHGYAANNIFVGGPTPAVLVDANGFPVTATNANANTVLAGPTSGGAAPATFRSLVAADIPTASASRLLNSQYGTATLTGNSSDQVVLTYTMPANTMSAGKGIRITARALQVGATGTTYKLTFGGTTIAASNANTVAANIALLACVFNQPALTNAQVSLAQPSGPSNGVFTSWAPTDSAIDTTSAVVVTLTFNVAATVTLTKYSWAIELVQ